MAHHKWREDGEDRYVDFDIARYWDSHGERHDGPFKESDFEDILSDARQVTVNIFDNNEGIAEWFEIYSPDGWEYDEFLGDLEDATDAYFES